MLYEIKYGCGHIGMKEINEEGKKRDKLINWYKYHDCPMCYSDKQHESNNPLTLKVSIVPQFVQCPFQVTFEGNTMPVKDEIRELGFKYGEIDDPDYHTNLTNRPKKRWCLMAVNMDGVIDIADRVRQKFPSISIQKAFTAADVAEMDRFKAAAEEKESRKKREIAAVPKPSMPEEVKGGRWNHRVYGSPGNYSVYVDGQKRELTDDRAKVVMKYDALYEKYQAKIDEIKRKYS